MLNEPFNFNGNFFTSSSSPKIFGQLPKSKSRPKIWIYPYYSLPLPGLILLHNSKVFKLLHNYPPPVVRFVEVFLCSTIMVYKPWEVQGNLENLENLMFANILSDNILMFENILHQPSSISLLPFDFFQKIVFFFFFFCTFARRI